MNLPLHLASYREINAFIEGIDVLFMTRGQQVYSGEQHAGLTMLEHSLQCAQLAEGAQAPAQLVAAALLHDVGHFLAPPEMCGNHDVDNTHEERAYVLLATALPAEVTEPVRLHVAAKRYLIRSCEAHTLGRCSHHPRQTYTTIGLLPVDVVRPDAHVDAVATNRHRRLQLQLNRPHARSPARRPRRI